MKTDEQTLFHFKTTYKHILCVSMKKQQYLEIQNDPELKKGSDFETNTRLTVTTQCSDSNNHHTCVRNELT